MNALLESVPEPYRQWIMTAGLAAAAALAALIVHAVVFAVAGRLTRRTEGVADTSAVKHTRRPAAAVFVLVAVRLALPATPLSAEAQDAARHLVAIGLIAAVTWLVIRALSVIDDVILSRYRIDVSDNLEARRVHTQTRVLTRTAAVVALIVGLSAVLMTFPAIRQLGASLLASAGIAGLVVGFAARPTLGNLIAGLQLAMSQPIRLDDVVIVEGEWGRIEEILATYVVVRIWDERRLIVPLQYFIEHPFQNWTRRTADILGTVLVHADYRIPIDKVRAELRRIVEASDKWDHRVCALQVTDATDRTIQMRALVSAGNASSAWELRCLVRERLIEYIQREHPDCLPRARADIRTQPGAEAR